jgi:hypothetical protein
MGPTPGIGAPPPKNPLRGAGTGGWLLRAAASASFVVCNSASRARMRACPSLIAASCTKAVCVRR